MATTHGISVVKNHCYVAPRHPKTNKPATENERSSHNSETDENREGESDRVSGENGLTSTRSHKRHRSRRKHASAREALSRSVHELEGVDEENFYDRLVTLRNEHKKTLKAVEALYYGEVEKQRSGIQLDARTRISVDEDEPRMAYKEYDPGDYNPFEEVGLDGKDKWPMASTAADHVKDMSTREESNPRNRDESYFEVEKCGETRGTTRGTTNSSDSDSRSDDDRGISKEESKKNTARYREMFPGRASALDKVEDMWQGFSVYDYPPDPLSPPKDSRKNKSEWTPSITIPQPFSMTVRDAKKLNKEKTRSQKLLEEDLRLKKERDEAELNKRFRAQPVPATTFLPLYDEINRQNDLRRHHVRELSKAILKATEKPFKFLKREEGKKHLRRTKSLSNLSDLESKVTEKKKFKANPFPSQLFGLTLADKITEQDEYRAIRMRMRSEEMLASSRLPPNMESRGREHTDGKLRRKLMEKREKKAFLTKEHKFKPQINPDVPDFDELQWQFEKELRRKKNEREPTVVEPFNLRTAHASAARKARSRSQEIKSAELSDRRSRSQSRERPSSARLSASQVDALPYGTTESARLRESTIRRSLDERSSKLDKERKDENKRRKRRKNLQPQVARKAQANDHSWRLKKSSEEKLRSFRESDRARRDDYHRELQEIQERLEKRPLLFEREAQASAKRTAERKYADILRGAGVDEGLVENLVTREGKIVDVESDDDDDDEDDDDDDFGDTGSYYKFPGARPGSDKSQHDEEPVHSREESESEIDEDISEDEAETRDAEKED